MKLSDPNFVAMVNEKNEVIIGPNGIVKTMDGRPGAFGGEENDIVYLVDSMGVGHPYILRNGEVVWIDMPKKIFGKVINAQNGALIRPLEKFYDPDENEFDFSDLEPGSLVKLVFPESFGENIPITNHQTAPDGLYVVTPDLDDLEGDDDEEGIESYLVSAKTFYEYCSINANALATLTELYGDKDIEEE